MKLFNFLSIYSDSELNVLEPGSEQRTLPHNPHPIHTHPHLLLYFLVVKVLSSGINTSDIENFVFYQVFFIKYFQVYFGFPQGSVLGPSLFSVYTSPVPAIALRHGLSIKQFSDDTQRYVHFNMDPHSQYVALGPLADCAADTGDCFNANCVKLNLGKGLLFYIVPLTSFL
jgi:hypothetical protein